MILLISLVFVGAGVWFVSMDSARIEASRRFNDPLFVHGFGYLTIVFGLISCAFLTKKLFDKKTWFNFKQNWHYR